MGQGLFGMIDYSDHLQHLKTQSITSALQLLAQADRQSSLIDRRDCVETCNRLLETLAGKTSTSLHKHVSSNTVNKPVPLCNN